MDTQAEVEAGKKAPYPVLFHAVRNEWKLRHLPKLDLFVVMSLILQESGGEKYFYGLEKQFRENLAKLCSVTFIKPKEWLDYIEFEVKPGQIAYPKFRIEPVWWYGVEKKWSACDYNRLEHAYLSCSYGLGQQSAMEFTAHNTCQDRIPIINKFVHDEAGQIAQVFKYFLQLLDTADGAFYLACTMYNGGPGCKQISQYGREVMERAYELQEKTSDVAVGGW